MKNVIILGTGGCASEVTFYISDNNSTNENEEKINLLGYIDYKAHAEKNFKKYQYKAPLLCDIDAYQPSPDEEVLIAVADIDFRKKMIRKLRNKNAVIGSFVHHSVIKPKNAEIGKGNIVYPFCILEQYAKIGDYNLITSFSCISHDCVVGNNNFFSSSRIAGAVKIGDNNFFGISATVIPGVEIGNNNVIQAGMVVDKNIKDDTTIFYRYKEQVLAIPQKKYA